MVVLGIEPTRAETGYGYIETGDYTKDETALHVRRSLRNPTRTAPVSSSRRQLLLELGIFLWSARTLANAVREHLPETAPLLEGIAAAFGTPKFEEVFHALYPKCENISVITPCLSRARPRANTSPISIACPLSSVGTTWAPGPRFTSTSLSPACWATAKAM